MIIRPHRVKINDSLLEILVYLQCNANDYRLSTLMSVLLSFRHKFSCRSAQHKLSSLVLTLNARSVESLTLVLALQVESSMTLLQGT